MKSGVSLTNMLDIIPTGLKGVNANICHFRSMSYYLTQILYTAYI